MNRRKKKKGREDERLIGGRPKEGIRSKILRRGIDSTFLDVLCYSFQSKYYNNRKTPLTYVELFLMMTRGEPQRKESALLLWSSKIESK
jgi:hypothetical protein